MAAVTGLNEREFNEICREGGGSLWKRIAPLL